MSLGRKVDPGRIGTKCSICGGKVADPCKCACCREGDLQHVEPMFKQEAKE